MQKQYIVYDKSESVAQSLATDAVTFGALVFSIWFSQAMGSGMWEGISLMMFGLFGLARMPWEKITRTTKLEGKAAAKAWAEALPDDV